VSWIEQTSTDMYATLGSHYVLYNTRLYWFSDFSYFFYYSEIQNPFYKGNLKIIKEKLARYIFSIFLIKTLFSWLYSQRVLYWGKYINAINDRGVIYSCHITIRYDGWLKTVIDLRKVASSFKVNKKFVFIRRKK
jgi:hypothetical protein